MANIIVLVTCMFLLAGALGKPAIDEDSELHVCYSLSCPKETTICGKTSEVSPEDKTKLNVHTKCFDAEGTILKSENTTEDNPWGPNVYYKGTKLTAVVTLNPDDSFYLSNSNAVSTKNVPNFYNIPNYPKEVTGPKSEIEDLNS